MIEKRSEFIQGKLSVMTMLIGLHKRVIQHVHISRVSILRVTSHTLRIIAPVMLFTYASRLPKPNSSADGWKQTRGKSENDDLKELRRLPPALCCRLNP